MVQFGVSRNIIGLDGRACEAIDFNSIHEDVIIFKRPTRITILKMVCRFENDVKRASKFQRRLVSILEMANGYGSTRVTHSDGQPFHFENDGLAGLVTVGLEPLRTRPGVKMTCWNPWGLFNDHVNYCKSMEFDV